MSEFSHIIKLYEFAKENGFKVKDLNNTFRSNSKGEYAYVELALIVPIITETQKEEVTENEV